jgi:hypothetical protein
METTYKINGFPIDFPFQSYNFKAWTIDKKKNRDRKSRDTDS